MGEIRQRAAEAQEIMLSVSSYRAILPKFVFQLTSNHMTPAGIETYTNYMGQTRECIRSTQTTTAALIRNKNTVNSSGFFIMTDPFMSVIL